MSGSFKDRVTQYQRAVNAKNSDNYIEPLKGLHWKLARKMAGESEGNFRLGAVVCRGKTPIGLGYNQQGSGKSHPIVARYTDREGYLSLHAEIHATVGLHPEKLRGSRLYVVRVRRDGSQGSARPCANCQREIKEKGIVKIYYSLDDEGFAAMRLH